MKEETTKEIKNIEELKEKEEPVEEEEILEESPEEKEEEKKEEPKEEKPKMSPKKKWIIIGSIAGAVILLLIIILLLVFHKKDNANDTEKKSTDSPFVTIVKEALESGQFDKEIKKGLNENDIKTEEVYIINLDIDSDEEQEIIVYAEEKEKRCILSLEIDEDIYYDDSYLLDAKDAIGYAYSSERAENLWYTKNGQNYTIIESTKKIIKEEDFLQNYVSLTKQYKQKNLLENAVSYKLGDKLDAKKLEKNAITNKALLKDNNLKEEETKAAYDKYIQEKVEKEAKEKEEAEAAARAEEERNKTQGTLKIGEHSYKFGRYQITNADGEVVGSLTIYADLTCIYNDQACKYSIGDLRDANDALVPGLAVYNGPSFITTVDEGVMVDPKTSNILKYVG